MKYQDRIKRIAHEEMDQIRDLFQANEPAPDLDLSNLEASTTAIHNLLKDVKTEVQSIEKHLKQPNPSEEEKKPEEESRESTPEEKQRRLKLLEDIGRRLMELNDPSLKMLPDDSHLPIPFGSKPEGFSNPESWLLRLLLGLWDYANTIEKKITDKFVENRNTKNLQLLLQKSIDNANNINTILRELFSQDDVLSNLSQSMADCCQDLHDEIDDVKRVLNSLEPQKSAGMDLAILRNTKFLIGEVSTIRGLL